MTKSTKFLSIVTRMSLADQHSKSFKGVHMHNYQDMQGNLTYVKSLVICLNSLHKLKELTDDEIKQYIVYIDECQYTKSFIWDN